MTHNRVYDETIGYSPLEQVDREKMRRTVAVSRRMIESYFHLDASGLVLVAGAGLGDEAGLVHELYGLRTVGIDFNIVRKPDGFDQPGLDFQRQDLHFLAFRDQVFLFVYSYHVLEHVADPMQVLKELERVLSPGGTLYIGFPNKNRLFAYIGTSQKATLLEKLKWNASDYLLRLQGKFENRFGAHAGFSNREFLQLASGVFKTVYPVRDRYMQYKYPGLARILRWIVRLRMDEFLFPSNYYLCRKA